MLNWIGYNPIVLQKEYFTNPEKRIVQLDKCGFYDIYRESEEFYSYVSANDAMDTGEPYAYLYLIYANDPYEIIEINDCYYIRSKSYCVKLTGFNNQHVQVLLDDPENADLILNNLIAAINKYELTMSNNFKDDPEIVFSHETRMNVYLGDYHIQHTGQSEFRVLYNNDREYHYFICKYAQLDDDKQLAIISKIITEKMEALKVGITM